MDLTTAPLFQLALDTAEADHSELPRGLEQRVLARIRAEQKRLQHPTWTDTDSPPISALAGFIKTAAELADLMQTLDDQDWASATHMDRVTVRDLVEHLVGVERYVLGQLGRRPALKAPRREDHWTVTRLAAADVAHEPASHLLQTWWGEVLQVIAACGELGSECEVSYHHLTGSLRGLLVVRTFELWTHGDDIRLATRRPLDELDEDRLRLMVSQLMRVLPLGLALSGCPQPRRTARLNLTGPGGGAFDVALAPGNAAGEPDITLAAGVIDLCRLAANRAAWDEMDILIEGDVCLLEPILAGLTAFAAD